MTKKELTEGVGGNCEAKNSRSNLRSVSAHVSRSTIKGSRTLPSCLITPGAVHATPTYTRSSTIQGMFKSPPIPWRRLHMRSETKYFATWVRTKRVLLGEWRLRTLETLIEMSKYGKPQPHIRR